MDGMSQTTSLTKYSMENVDVEHMHRTMVWLEV
jgi:hypothetical protein